jgi:hypothetical protein
MICKHKLVSNPEVVVGAHAQAQVEAVISQTRFTTFTLYSHFILFWGACRLKQTPTSKWCGLTSRRDPATNTTVLASTTKIGPGTRLHHLGHATASWWALKGCHNISGEQHKRVPTLGLLYDDRLSASRRAAASPTVANAADSVLALGGCTTDGRSRVQHRQNVSPGTFNHPCPLPELLLVISTKT